MFKVGSGFNVGFVNPKTSKAHLPFPKNISLLELGPEELTNFKLPLHQLQDIHHFDISLHIARSPITESRQDDYIENISILSRETNFQSIGFHLIGPRISNIGKFGFSSYYDPTNPCLESNAIRFISKIQDKTNCNVWIENTNFYSDTHSAPLALWESIRRISEKTNAKLIIDLSHHLIDCLNVGISPDLLFGAIPWKYVAELHLSGINRSKDGAYHDGHSQPIPETIWSYLEKIISFFIHDISLIYVTLEHTDFRWTKESEKFFNDFERLEKLKRALEKGPNHFLTFSDKAEQYAKSRLKKFLEQHFSKVKEKCIAHGVEFDFIFEQWLSSINFSNGHRLVFSSYEEDLVAFNCKKLFNEFIMEKYPNVCTY